MPQRAGDGDEESWGALLTRHADLLRRMVAFRMDQRLQGRIDPSDVIQETYLEASKHLAEYLRESALAFFLWLRGIAGNKLRELHRYHLATQMRDGGREVSLYRGTLPEATSASAGCTSRGRRGCATRRGPWPLRRGPSRPGRTTEGFGERWGWPTTDSGTTSRRWWPWNGVRATAGSRPAPMVSF
jgi:hypothetical protein